MLGPDSCLQLFFSAPRRQTLMVTLELHKIRRLDTCCRLYSSLPKDYSTKLAPWLAFGCLSPRKIFEQIREYEKEIVANKSTYWVLFELMWRDFYRFFAAKHGNQIFKLHGISGKGDWKPDQELFRLWAEGKTGYPLVDANMRELSATGFMSNRGRQNVASFLALDMKLEP
eukprot:g19036.t1